MDEPLNPKKRRVVEYFIRRCILATDEDENQTPNDHDISLN